jgi:hypothetical protein
MAIQASGGSTAIDRAFDLPLFSFIFLPLVGLFLVLFFLRWGL